MKNVTVNGRKTAIEDELILRDLALEAWKEGDDPIALAEVNGRLRELSRSPAEGDEISFVTIRDTAGYDAFRRSMSMLFIASVRDCYGKSAGSVILHFAEGSGFFFTAEGEIPVDDAFAERVENRMRQYVADKALFRKSTVSVDQAMAYFERAGMQDKKKLFETRLKSTVNMYRLGEYEDYYYGYMLYDTSLLGCFRLIPCRGGIVLQMPERGTLDKVPEYQPYDKLFSAKIEGEQWAETQKIGCVADLNEQIIRGDASRMILVSEALQEAKISDIAEMIAARKDVRFVMIAGPSSSGKTTFSQRLSIQLSAHGMTPHFIGTDNYFINREDMVPGPDGKIDFEGLSAVDVEQFNRDMEILRQGGTVEVPTFDFVTGRRVMSGETLTLGESDILVIEGLHSLNDRLSIRLPKESMFRIYISALNMLNIDEHNRVPSGDGRLIRRIVRDNRTRGYSASQTLAQWETVRKGETENIFPYQESADVVFNSALPYELAALKTYVQPLLFQVRMGDPSYHEAKRLLKFLDYFIPVPDVGVPVNSILREFIGGGCFRL